MTIEKYYYNSVTGEIITHDDFVSRCKKYKKDLNSDSSIREIMENDDEVLYIGKFSSVEEATKCFEEEF